MNIQQFKDHWLIKVLYNNYIAIDNFNLCVNLHAYVGDMTNLEAQYHAYHPYANDFKFKEHKDEQSKKETESTFNNKKRGSESQVDKSKKDSKILPTCYSCGKGHNGECFLGKHPDSNKNPQIKFSDAAVGKLWLENDLILLKE